MIYIFDIDGTLTPHRQVIDPEFKHFFTSFCNVQRVVLVTGSDMPKAVEQLGQDMIDNVEAVYTSGGNVGYADGKIFHTNDIDPTVELMDFIEDFIKNSEYPERNGTHIEHRTGMLNVSTVGRDSTHEQRMKYATWDVTAREREVFAAELNAKFPDYEASVGGMISVDIINRGFDKSQVVDDMDDTIMFFGDNIKKGGNDLPIAMASDVAFIVKNYKETWNILKKLF